MKEGEGAVQMNDCTYRTSDGGIKNSTFPNLVDVAPLLARLIHALEYRVHDQLQLFTVTLKEKKEMKRVVETMRKWGQ